MNEVGLGLRSPDGAARALAVTVARPIERNHSIFLGSHVNKTARVEILDHAAVAMQQDKRLPATPLKKVQLHAMDVEKFARWWIVTLSLPGEKVVGKGGGCQSKCDNDGGDLEPAGI